MTIQFVGGQYHGESRPATSKRHFINMPPVRGHIVQAMLENDSQWFPVERYQTQEYRDSGLDTVVAGESRRVFIYIGE